MFTQLAWRSPAASEHALPAGIASLLCLRARLTGDSGVLVLQCQTWTGMEEARLAVSGLPMCYRGQHSQEQASQQEEVQVLASSPFACTPGQNRLVEHTYTCALAGCRRALPGAQPDEVRRITAWHSCS